MREAAHYPKSDRAARRWAEDAPEREPQPIASELHHQLPAGDLDGRRPRDAGERMLDQCPMRRAERRHDDVLTGEIGRLHGPPVREPVRRRHEQVLTDLAQDGRREIRRRIAPTTAACARASRSARIDSGPDR